MSFNVRHGIQKESYAIEDDAALDGGSNSEMLRRQGREVLELRLPGVQLQVKIGIEDVKISISYESIRTFIAVTGLCAVALLLVAFILGIGHCKMYSGELGPCLTGELGPCLKEWDVYSDWTMKRLTDSKRVMRPPSAFKSFEEICASIRHGNKWSDNENPKPHMTNILYNMPENASENRGVTCELLKGPIRLRAGARADFIDANDVRQGYLGDCWFLAAMSAVADLDALDNRCHPSHVLQIRD